jgi:hypothetical protein
MRKALVLGAFAVLTVVPKFANANELKPDSYDERINSSDVIIIGKALSLSGSGASECCNNFAAIGVTRVLKGHPSHIIDVFTQNDVIDLDPWCCEVGKTYLFFLSTRPGAPYAIVNGHFGAIPLD